MAFPLALFRFPPAALLVGLGVLVSRPATLAAQSRTAGRVARVVGGDTLPVGRLPVVLHRVARAAQGPVDTVASDGAGRFAFRFATDSTAAYLLSARYDGIEYFSSAVSGDPVRPDTGVLILVADTSSTASVVARERTVLISRPDESGTRTVVDWFVLLNAGDRTRVAADSLRPAWAAPLPPDAQNVELADARLSQFSPDAIEFRGDSALVFAPLSPGRKELVLQYRIPGGLRRFSAPSAEGTESLFVLLEEWSARVLLPALSVADSQRLDGRLFRRWTGAVRGGSPLVIAFPAAPMSPRTVLALLVGVAALGFAGLALARRRPARAALGVPHPLYLADAIARLDAAYQERGAPATAEEHEAYAAERARLKAALSAALAAVPPRS